MPQKILRAARCLLAEQFPGFALCATAMGLGNRIGKKRCGGMGDIFQLACQPALIAVSIAHHCSFNMFGVPDFHAQKLRKFHRRDGQANGGQHCDNPCDDAALVE